MHKLLTIIFMNVIVAIRCQLHFPQDSIMNKFQLGSDVKNLSAIQRDAYDTDINDIIERGILKLTLSMDRIISNDPKNAKIAVYSPVGISGALALVLLGATGKTFDELSAVMGLASGINIQSNSQLVHEHIGRLLKDLQKNSNTDIGAQVKFASAVFVQDDYPIRSIYKNIADEIYRSEILNLDFNSNSVYAQNVINAWVANRTNSKIKTMLEDPPPSRTRVIICSALYFLGQWEKPFFNGLTRKRPFYPNGAKSNDRVMTDMMSNGGTFPYYKDTTLNCEILGFPYKGNKTTMYVILPRNSNKETLRNFENRLTPTDIERLVDNTKYTQTVILFPKMTLESTIDLKDALKQLGATTLFNPRESNLGVLSYGFRLKTANVAENIVRNPTYYVEPTNNNNNDMRETLIFSRFGPTENCSRSDPSNTKTNCGRINENRPKRQTETLDSLRKVLNSAENPGLYADQVIHKVYMDITETGTEAAAATSVSLSRGGDIVTFRVDVPFLFFIRDEETKLILFWGSVYTPPPSSH